MKRNPWLGLASYEEHLVTGEEKYEFCGRAAATADLFALVDNNLFVTLYGKSGIGKSSILQAGLFPKLRANRYLPLHIRLGVEEQGAVDDSYAEIIVKLLLKEIKKCGCTCNKIDKGKPENNHAERDSEYLNGNADDYLWNFFAIHEFRDRIGQVIFPVVVLDQFEELFFRPTEKLAKLLQQIYLLLDDSTQPDASSSDITNFRFMFSIREDDFFRLEDIIERLSLVEMKYNRYRLKELSDSDAREVIEVPAGDLLPFDQRDTIIERIITTVKNESDNKEISTAILSLLCSRIFDYMKNCGAESISMSMVNRFLASSGGNFLSSFYNNIIAELKDRKKWEYIEDNLVTDDGRRNYIPKSLFEANVKDAKFLFKGQYAILRHVTYSSGREPAVEIIHDLLAHNMVASRNERYLKQTAGKLRRKHVKNIASTIIVILGLLFVYHYYSKLSSEKNLLMLQSRFLISEAEKLIDKGNVTKATKLLLYASPKNLKNLDRPFLEEVGYMLRIANMRLRYRVTVNHQSWVKTAVFNKKGDLFVTASWDKTVRVCNTVDGSIVGVPIKHDNYVFSAEFSPDGNNILTASADRTARLWRVVDGSPVGTPMKHNDWVKKAEFSPNGKYIVTASWDNTARVWSAVDGSPIGPPLKHNESVNSATFSPDSKFVVTASSDSSARIWNFIDGVQVGSPMMHGSYVNSAVFSPNGEYIVTASDDYYARLWNVEDGTLIGTMKHDKSVTSAVFSPDLDGEYILTSSLDCTSRLWSRKDCSPIGKHIMRHNNEINSAIFSPKGNYILTASKDNSVRLWDAKDGTPIHNSSMLHKDNVNSAVFSNDEKYILSASDDRTACLWITSGGFPLNTVKKNYNTNMGKLSEKKNGTYKNANIKDIGNILMSQIGIIKYESEISSAIYSPNKKYILTLSENNTSELWSMTGDRIGVISHDNKKISSAIFSTDGMSVLTTSNKDNIVNIWQVDNAKKIHQLKHENKINSAVFNDNSKYVVTASNDNIFLWDLMNPSTPIYKRHYKAARIADSIADTCIIICNSTAYLLNINDGNIIGSPMKHGNSVNSAVFSPNGKYIVTASDDHYALLWKAEDGKPIGAPMKHDGCVNYATFSSDSKYVVTVSDDKTARLWNSNNASPVRGTNKNIMLHNDKVNSVVISPNGKYIITASDDNTNSIWNLNDLKQIGTPIKYKYGISSSSFNHDGTMILRICGNKVYFCEFPIYPLQDLLDRYNNDGDKWKLTDEEKKEYFLE